MRKFIVGTAMLAGMAEAKPNPIRRVVTLLQEMSKEISDEVEKEKKMYEKFQCYCKKNNKDLGAKVEEAAALIKKTKAEVASLTGQKKQLKEEIKQHKKERKQAEEDLKATTEKRAEEKAKFDEETKDVRKTLSDLSKAIAALEKGMGKSFLQTNAGRYLSKSLTDNVVSVATQSLDISEQQQLNSFLQSGTGNSGEIVGILKAMKDNIDADLGGVLQQEATAVKAFNTMKASLNELIKTSGASIEKKMELAGTVAVKIVEGKNKITTTEKQMGDDMKTAAELKEACGDKVGEFDTRQKDAAMEVEAINQAIGILNNDDALELFKSTDTKSFTQLSLLQLSTRAPVAEALRALNADKFVSKPVALMAFSARQMLAAKAGKVDFSKVVKMIDDMSALLKQEADDDLASRDDCTASLNDSEAEKKEVGHAIKGLNAQIEDAAAVIETTITSIEKAKNEIAAAKEAMAGASKQRTEENAEFITNVELNKQAVDLILKAKDKLNAYYNPDLVRKGTRDESTEEAQARVQASLAQLPEAPEIFSGERKNKSQKSGGVLALMDTLANDLNKDTAAMEHAEATAQRDYEKLSQDLSEQVVSSQKAQNEAQKTKADTEAEKQTLESTLSMKSEEATDIENTIRDLHAKCDFILSAFEERKAARENEIDGLAKAKAVLAGANFA